MKILKEKFLTEEELQNPQINEFNPEDEEASFNTDLEDAPQDEEESTLLNDTDIESQIPMSKTWKVNYKLGGHENWSRYDAGTKEEAEQEVTKYITNKWPDRHFEIVDTEEYIEEELKETLNESTITDAQPIETGAKVGMAALIGDLIKDEYEAIDAYNSAIVTAEAEGFSDMINVLTEIQAEENLHVGQLQAIMNTLDPNAHLVDDGQQEGIEQLANPIAADITIEEDLEPELMSKADAEAFDKAVRERWDMSPLEFMQEYNAGRLPMMSVNTYEDIPNCERAIELDSVDISQGTGNVIVYTYMEPETGKLYKYASY